MRTYVHSSVWLAAALLVSACGLEQFFGNIGHQAYERPASKITGSLLFAELDGGVVVTDATGAVIAPFQTSIEGGKYELRLPSSSYTNLIVTARSGNASVFALLPSVGEESTVQLDLDARSTTEGIISLARLSADNTSWKQVTPSTYVATRTLIRNGFDTPGTTQDLEKIVEYLLTKFRDPASGVADPIFFVAPKLNADYTTDTSTIDRNWVSANFPDLLNDGKRRTTTAPFDDLLAAVAKLYRPAGCPDPTNIRTVFTVDFNANRKNGNCSFSDRFKWAVDKPGKSVFFVGWIHADSIIQDPSVAVQMGSGVPNQIPMHDDGTSGDEVAGDNIWTVAFNLPIGLRMGYKYTWGFRGAQWTGSEEWPGNSRILEITDVNNDGFVYRRDVFGDEATNKDKSNLNFSGTGVCTWTTDFGYGIEAREKKVDTNQDCVPDTWITPTSIGQLTVNCQ